MSRRRDGQLALWLQQRLYFRPLPQGTGPISCQPSPRAAAHRSSLEAADPDRRPGKLHQFAQSEWRMGNAIHCVDRALRVLQYTVRRHPDRLFDRNFAGNSYRTIVPGVVMMMIPPPEHSTWSPILKPPAAAC